jgi:hypothetical protein
MKLYIATAFKILKSIMSADENIVAGKKLREALFT